MNFSSLRQAVLVLSLMLLWVISMACGSSRQSGDYTDEAVDLDELLGEEAVSPGDESEQAEVLRLLGIQPDEERAQPANISKMDPEPVASELQADVDRLKDELTEKDQQISELRAQLTEKEMRVTDLESQVKKNQMSSRPMGRVGEPSPQFRSRYETALNTFKARNYREAINLFSQLLSVEINNSLSDNCQYWIGESYYGLGQYNQAITEFEKVFSFPNSNKSDDAQLKLGLCYLKLGDKAQARAELDRMLSIYPGSEYVAIAQKYINKL